MTGQCVKHQFETAENTCRTCGFDFCAECLVYAFGDREPPYCIACALAAAGVRSNAARRPALSRREIRRKVKEQRRAEKAARREPQRIEVTAMDAGWAPPPPDADDFGWADPSPGERVPF